MKALRKNIYVAGVIILFVIAVAMLGLFLALFSSSTAVDGTIVGSVYIGDKKPNTEARKQKLVKGVDTWKKNAIYTISFQNVSVRIGDTPKLDENGNVVTIINEETGKEEIVYDHKGLVILDFDYETTNSKIINGEADNLAYFSISDENKAALYQILVDTFGSEVTANRYFEYQKLIDAIIKDANNMNTKSDYDLYDFVNTDWSLTEVAQIDIENLSTSKVDELTELFNGVEVEILPQKNPDGKLGFSAVEFFSKPEYSTMTSSDMSIIATGFAAVVMNTSLTVTVKNQGYVSDRYYAFNDMTARVNIKDGTDLRIINPETHSYIITISKGRSIIDGKASLNFKLEGCKFVNDFTITKNETIFDNNIIYDSEIEFDYDPTNPNMGIDTEYDGGCYYEIIQQGVPTYLYSYTKTTTHVDGSKDEIEVYPKQEFFVGRDELRYWTHKGYNE